MKSKMSLVTNKLYVANVDETYEDEHLLNIVTHILNVAAELEINSRANHIYHKIGIEDDDANTDIRSILPDAIEWIHEAIQQGGVVCVHCLEGRSRSVCVCIAYLCVKLGWKFQDAIAWVAKQRPTIDIFPLYQAQLEAYITSCFKPKNI